MSKCLQVQYNGINSDAEFKEFEPFFKLETQLKHGWVHLELFQDLSRRFILNWFLAVELSGFNT